jgi:hypothetical protein
VISFGLKTGMALLAVSIDYDHARGATSGGDFGYRERIRGPPAPAGRGDARRVRPCRAHPDGGFAIGAGFQAGTTAAVVVAIAVISHDFAGGFTTCTIISLYGNNRWRR